MPFSKELPGWKQLYIRVFAGRLLATLSFDATFNVGHVLEGGTEHVLLLGTVLAPVKPVHSDILARQTLGKTIVAMVVLVFGREPHAPDHEDNYSDDRNLLNAQWFVLLLALFLSSSSLFRHFFFSR
jgi:hypothetical protein